MRYKLGMIVALVGLIFLTSASAQADCGKKGCELKKSSQSCCELKGSGKSEACCNMMKKMSQPKPGLGCCGFPQKSPCPMVALSKAKELNLSAKQIKEIEKIKKDVMKDSDSIHKKIHAKEEFLHKGLALQKLDESQMEKILREIGSLKTDMRVIRLKSHLATVKVLTQDQIKGLAEGKPEEKQCDLKKKKDCDKDGAKKRQGHEGHH